jgi:hypothetical protein
MVDVPYSGYPVRITQTEETHRTSERDTLDTISELPGDPWDGIEPITKGLSLPKKAGCKREDARAYAQRDHLSFGCVQVASETSFPATLVKTAQSIAPLPQVGSSRRVPKGVGSRRAVKISCCGLGVAYGQGSSGEML